MEVSTNDLAVKIAEVVKEFYPQLSVIEALNVSWSPAVDIIEDAERRLDLKEGQD